MSRASVEQALTGLVPTLNGPLPPELIDIALSLLARSRSVASSLKPDEEIARPYACAQLACERLKARLNLPSIVSRPPCPPRVYKKLYNYLASALPDSTTPREPQTPRKNPASAPSSARATPKTPLSARKTPQTARKIDGNAGEPPAWVMPCIRVLAEKFSQPQAAPHVYAGMESISPLIARMAVAVAETPSKRPRRAASSAQAPTMAVSDTKVLALLVVVLLYVLTRMLGQSVTPEEYDERREMAIRTLLELPAAKNVTFDELLPVTEELMLEAQHEGWLQMEWFVNIGHVQDTDEMEGIESTNGTTIRPAANTSLGLRSGGSDYIGLGTMLQDATDYLGDRQRQDFKIFKADWLARYEEREKMEAGA